MKKLTIVLVIVSIILMMMGSYYIIYKPNSHTTKDLLLRLSPYLISLAIFIELYFDIDEHNEEYHSNTKKSKIENMENIEIL